MLAAMGRLLFANLSLGVAMLAAACASIEPAREFSGADPVKVMNRLSWGANETLAREVARTGVAAWIDGQLSPSPGDPLPAAISSRVAAFEISRVPFDVLARGVERERIDSLKMDPIGRDPSHLRYQVHLNSIAGEGMSRFLLRALYSRNQLEEQMVWFWANHFSVWQLKANLRLLVADYEESAIRPHALGRFRDLVGATLRHPAMVRYLDVEENAASRINENYARELLELHTLGVGGGYSQADVQELARVLTGVTLDFGDTKPKLPPHREADYVRDGFFQFNPNRHDYGTKKVLDHEIRGRGLAEVEEVLDVICRHPSTARHVSRKLATYFVADDPPPALVERMAQTFQRTDGRIAAVLRTMIESPEFARSLGGKFKDPMHFAVSAARLAYDDQAMDPLPMVDWLNRMGEGLYGRTTPDGYPLTQSGWSGPGQLLARFEVARAAANTPFPPLSNAFYHRSIEATLREPTRMALERARSADEWNAFLLSSPEFMSR
jgi:uncharacterized protein (DUF1800 family)